MLPVLDNLGRLPEHGDKWIKSVVRHPRVLDILDTYKVSKNHPSDFVRRRFSDEKLRERTRRWKVRRQHDGRITAILNPIMEEEQTKKPTKPNIITQSSHISSKSSSLSPLSTRLVSPHGATKAAGFVVYDDGDSLLAQSTIEKLQQEKAKYKTIKLDTAHLSSCVSLVPQPILYDCNDII
ncbi:hypothetical protein K492DRAFT_237938 [Lichtheimia hyalospora FSU 10163]|nr:hypothetical protein K492DRAFT_237938 [Lichtheimia hyalospora FSU 10163]